MGSPITFSGFNNIDFTSVLNAIMTQESRPLTALQTQQRTLQNTDSNYATFATKLGTLQSAAASLSSSTSLVKYATTVSDSTALTATATASAVEGRYEIKVTELARAQTTMALSTAPDADTTIVAAGGDLTIGGVAVFAPGAVTLRELANAINADADVPATASIVETAPGAFSLVLTGKESGTANGFVVDNNLTGSTVTFTDTDNDGVSGDTPADNVVNAINASLTINDIPISSASNTLENGVPGVTVQLLAKDPARTVVVTVAKDPTELGDRIQKFVDAYNDLLKFSNDQNTAAGKGTLGALGRDPVLRGFRNELRNALIGAHGSGAFTRLSEVGIEFERTGEISLDRTALSEALAASPADVASLFTDATTGAFTKVDDLIDQYTDADGFLPGARTRISDELSRLGKRVDDLNARLAVRRQSLQQQFIAADLAMTRLKSQSSALSGFSSSSSSI
jgi:flagellar hook-associated protein 2